ncbi:MAG: Crp/Fnr family transcriptional regulator [Dichotomicrobium sp.]
MKQIQARDFLGTVDIFKGLSDEQIDAIAACADITWFDTGGAITYVDNWGEAAFLVLSGSVMVADAAETSGYREPLGPGTLLGELAMLTEVSYAATVVAAEPVSALVIERDAFYRVLEDDPTIAEHIADRLAVRLSGLAEDLRLVDDRFEALESSLQRVAADA